MKRLHEIVKTRIDKENELSEKRKIFEQEKNKLISEIKELKRLENVGSQGIDLLKVQMAENIIFIKGNPLGKIDSGTTTILDLAINDIAENFHHLKNAYFGNKSYEAFYQRYNCEYGLGPKHGSVVDMIGLKSQYRDKLITDEEKDACIYYLKNYSLIFKV